MLNQFDINKKIETNTLCHIAFYFVLPISLCALFFMEVSLAFDHLFFFLLVLVKIYFANEVVFDILKENYEMERKLIQMRTKKNNVYPATNHNVFSALAMVAVLSPFGIYIMLLKKAKRKD